jgi:hypothetical protein
MEPVEGSLFVRKPYNPFRLGPLLDYMLAAKKIGSAPMPA